MAMNVTPFQSTDEFTMAGFNGKISDINSGVDNEIASALSGFARIETGSYVGTGMYGASNPNTLTFGFVPKVWGWFGYKNANESTFFPSIALVPWGEGTIYVGVGTGSADSCFPTYQNSSVSWYANSVQANQKNYTYYYIAIG